MTANDWTAIGVCVIAVIQMIKFSDEEGFLIYKIFRDLLKKSMNNNNNRREYDFKSKHNH